MGNLSDSQTVHLLKLRTTSACAAYVRTSWLRRKDTRSAIPPARPNFQAQRTARFTARRTAWLPARRHHRSRGSLPQAVRRSGLRRRRLAARRLAGPGRSVRGPGAALVPAVPRAPGTFVGGRGGRRRSPVRGPVDRLRRAVEGHGCDERPGDRPQPATGHGDGGRGVPGRRGLSGRGRLLHPHAVLGGDGRHGRPHLPLADRVRRPARRGPADAGRRGGDGADARPALAPGAGDHGTALDRPGRPGDRPAIRADREDRPQQPQQHLRQAGRPRRH